MVQTVGGTYVLLTVPLGIIFLNNQLEAQLLSSMFISSVGGRPEQDGHQHRLIIPDVVLIQLSSWGWAHSCSKHVEDSNKRIIEEIVRQVGYLPEL